MRPLARKILLTQGVIIVLVFGVSLFAYLQMRDAQRRAATLKAEHELGTEIEKLLTELRDIGRNHEYYFLEKRSPSDRLSELRLTFYESLERIGLGIEELAVEAATRPDLAGTVAELRERLDAYRGLVARQELRLPLEDPEGSNRIAALADSQRRAMRDLAAAQGQRRAAAVTREIDALGRRADRAAALALIFSGVALVVGLGAAYALTRSIHRPVRALRAATEALSRGEFDRRLQVKNRDELGDLARAFNEMAARLQELDELKSGFISMVSHDLKTPLTSMKEAVEMLSEGVGGELTARQQRLLAIAREGMERLGIYVQGILDLFRFEAGHAHLVREPLSLSDVVREQAGLAEARCREAGIALRRDLDPDLPPLEGDRFRLSQVVANLLDNAIKFTPRDGRIVLRTGVTPWEDDLGVFLEVADTGIGIASRDLRHIFDKFFQAADGGSRKVRGAGLGLAIVKSLVEAHAGMVDVQSAPGRGTTFTVHFPVARRQPVEPTALAG